VKVTSCRAPRRSIDVLADGIIAREIRIMKISR
jgi:hypothetical protein